MDHFKSFTTDVFTEEPILSVCTLEGSGFLVSLVRDEYWTRSCDVTKRFLYVSSSDFKVSTEKRSAFSRWMWKQLCHVKLGTHILLHSESSNIQGKQQKQEVFEWWGTLAWSRLAYFAAVSQLLFLCCSKHLTHRTAISKIQQELF